MSRVEIKTVDEIGEQWDDFVSTHPDATSYHRREWKAVVERSFGHRTEYLAACVGDAVVGILPLVVMKSRLFGRFLVSLPFFNYGGLLCSRDEARTALLDAATVLLRETGGRHLELRHVQEEVPGLPVKRHKVTMLLPLKETPDDQWRAFNPKLRNQIRKAEKSGLMFEQGGASLLDDFYAVFSRNMRDLGTPVYGCDFFGNILAAFPASARLLVVRHEGVPVAAGLVSSFRGRLEIPWASSVREFNHLCPNNLLYWGALRYAIETGHTVFDFGRSTPGEGTFRFKAQWGAEPVELKWQYVLPGGGELPNLNPANPKFRLAISAWQKLPLAVANFLGPRIVGSIP